jgi:integrase
MSVVELRDGSRLTGRTKSLAGRRVVSIPVALLLDVNDHLRRFVAEDPASGVFVGPKGAPLRRTNFQKHWNSARIDAGPSAIHFHDDLRHTGNTLAAQSGDVARPDGSNGPLEYAGCAYRSAHELDP